MAQEPAMKLALDQILIVVSLDLPMAIPDPTTFLKLLYCESLAVDIVITLIILIH
jgi:hypothetical protein